MKTFASQFHHPAQIVNLTVPYATRLSPRISRACAGLATGRP
jgi:hypothetical protein